MSGLLCRVTPCTFARLARDCSVRSAYGELRLAGTSCVRRRCCDLLFERNNARETKRMPFIRSFIARIYLPALCSCAVGQWRTEGLRVCLRISGTKGNEGHWGGGISIRSQNFLKSPSILFHPLESSISQVREIPWAAAVCPYSPRSRPKEYSELGKYSALHAQVAKNAAFVLLSDASRDQQSS
jgi:hypothetical protein